MDLWYTLFMNENDEMIKMGRCDNMVTFEEHLAELMKNPKFAEEYNRLQARDKAIENRVTDNGRLPLTGKRLKRYLRLRWKADRDD